MPVIIVTGDTDIDIAKTFVNMGANDFVNKPFEFGDLLVRVQKCLFKNITHSISCYIDDSSLTRGVYLYRLQQEGLFKQVMWFCWNKSD